MLFLGAILVLTACGGASENNTETDAGDATAIETADSTANAMDDIQAEIEAKKAELEEAVKAIEEDEN